MRALIQKIDRKLFFPFMSEAETSQYFVEQKREDHIYIKDSLKHSPPALRSYFEECMQKWGLNSFHFHYTKPCIIEPAMGYAITKGHRLIPQSLWGAYVHRLKPAYLKYLFKQRRTLQLPVAIPLQYGWSNYWHFFNDVIGAIALADAAGMPNDVPLLIPEGLAQKRFYQEILALSPALQKRNWILQSSDTNVYLQEAHFFGPALGGQENFDAVLRYINFDAVLRTEPAGNRRIFVGRRPDRGRNILNMDEVRRTLDRHSFAYVECDDLTVRQQIDLFQHAAYVVGIHGAGLTNIAFRRGRPMKLLEIFSADYSNPCYYWLCTQYGFNYYSLVGSATHLPGSNVGNFEVNIQELESQLLEMLQDASC
jgi:hypothetical protein